MVARPTDTSDALSTASWPPVDVPGQPALPCRSAPRPRQGDDLTGTDCLPRRSAPYGGPVPDQSSTDLPLNHVCHPECRGVVHVQGLIANADQSDDAFARDLARELAPHWQLVSVRPDADGPGTIGGRPMQVTFLRAAQ